MRQFFTFLFLWVGLSALSAQRLYDLRCEGLDNPLAIDNVYPHFSWKMESANPITQLGYEIEVGSDSILLQQGKADMWASGKVVSSEQVMVPYRGKNLSSRNLYYWRVKVYTEGGKVSEWSSIQRFGIGVLGESPMQGEWVSMPSEEDDALLVHKRFRIRQAGKPTLLHVNSLGYHEVYINGHKVTDYVLAPSVSQLDKRSIIVTYDLSPLLHKGENDLVLWIGSGWYKKDTFRATHQGPVVRADLDVKGKNGWETMLKTDNTWEVAKSGYRGTGTWQGWQFDGEIIDAAQVPACLCKKELDKIKWQQVEKVEISGISAVPQMCQQNVVKETISPVAIDLISKDTWRIDVGKALHGLFDIRLPELPAGHQVKATYADHLNEKGKLDGVMYEDIFIASGNPEGDHFCNRFNHHCFRYVELSNLPEKPEPSEIKVYRIGIGAEVTGSFSCSDKDLNDIHHMLSYTMDNLAYSGYMVDCAHIEQLGYGGDGNASTLSLQNNFDVAPMFVNWLQAWNDAIRNDGGLPHTAPNPYCAGGGPYWCTFIVQAPWRTWMNFGDDRLLYRCYESMKRGLRYVDAHTKDGLLKKWPDTEYRGWYLGDWLAPRGTDVTMEESVDLVNNCALSQAYNQLIQIADHLNRPSEQADFQKRRADLNKRIHETFYHAEDKTYGTGSQLDMTYPMLVGAVPQELVEDVTKSLLKRTSTQYQGHLNVGLVGVPVMAEWATLSKQADFVYGMLKQDSYPGYLYMIRNGATSTWEDWDNPRSYLHNCFNGMDSWFYQALGGILPTTPGYKHTRIEPQTPAGLNWVRVARETPYGTIRVSWTRQEEGIKVQVVIPNGIIATVDGKEVGGGSYEYIMNPSE